MFSVQIFTSFPRGGPLDRSTMGRLTPLSATSTIYVVQVGINDYKQILEFISSSVLLFSDNYIFYSLAGDKERERERETLRNSSMALSKELRLHHALIQSAGFREQLNCFSFPSFRSFSFASFSCFFFQRKKTVIVIARKHVQHTN